MGDSKDSKDEKEVVPLGPKMRGWTSPQPMPVTVQFLITDLLGIDSVKGSYRLNIDFCMDWFDHGSIEKGEEEGTYDLKSGEELWSPNIVLLNALDKVEMESEIFEANPLPKENTVCVNQTLTYNLEFRAPMDLQDFPFDKQKLPVHFISNLFTRDKLRWVPIQKKSTEIISPDVLVRLTDFAITNVSIRHSDFTAGYLARYSDTSIFHELSLILHVTRRPEYYLTRIVSVIVFLLVMAGGAFFVSPDEIADRLGLSITLFLTAVAFHFVVSADLPKIAYATRLDKLLAFMYCLLFATAVEHIISNRLTRSYSQSYVEDTCDLAAIIVYYVVLLAGTVWFLLPTFSRSEEDVVLAPDIKITSFSEEERAKEAASGVGAVRV
jgi:hypothetical protein